MNNSICGVKIKSIVCAYPQNVVDLKTTFDSLKFNYTKFQENVGVNEKRSSYGKLTTLDLCEKAFNSTINKLLWNPETIDLLMFVSQTPDYSVPSSSLVLQGKLGLKKSTICIDISKGCTGWVEGLIFISGLMKSLNLKKGVLLAGETNILTSKSNDNNFYLMGDAGSATFLEIDEEYSFTYDILNNGSMFDAIIAPHSGARYLSSLDSAKDNFLLSPTIQLNGKNVFEFVVKHALPQMKQFIEENNIKNEIEIIALHQASKIIIDYIEKKITLTNVHFPKSLEKFGNTSSASIPLSICIDANEKSYLNKKILCCAFGVGMSSAIIYFRTGNDFTTDLVEL
jgi:3-oxoacyl-[acyl-carrier-protein] synthase-3